MKNSFLFILTCLVLFSCSPVLRRDVMERPAADKDIRNSPQAENKVLPRSLDYLRPEDIRWRWGGSRSVTEGKYNDNKMLPVPKESLEAKQILTNTVEQKYDDKESPASHDIKTGKPVNPELSGPGIQTDMNEKTDVLPKEEEHVASQKPVVQAKKSDDDKYYVQIGAWKSLGLAETMLNNIKKFYPKAYIIFVNDLHKVRVPGGQTKEEGLRISKDIEKKFMIKAFVALNP